MRACLRKVSLLAALALSAGVFWLIALHQLSQPASCITIGTAMIMGCPK